MEDLRMTFGRQKLRVGLQYTHLEKVILVTDTETSRRRRCRDKVGDRIDVAALSRICNQHFSRIMQLALSQRLSLLGFIFRSPIPTFVKILPDRFY